MREYRPNIRSYGLQVCEERVTDGVEMMVGCPSV